MLLHECLDAWPALLITRQAPLLLRAAELGGIDDEDFCPDRSRSIYDGCAAHIEAAYEADNGMGVSPPLSPDDDDNDSN